MDAPSGRQFANAPFLIGTLLLVCALTFYYFAVLRVDYTKTTLLDLAPHPDATEYFAQAKALYRDAMAFHTNWIRETAIKVSAWISGADASVAEDPAGSRRRAGTISHESNSGAAPAFGRICFLHIPGDAVDGRFCGLVTGNAPRLLYFLSFVTKRSECLLVDCTSIHVCILGR